MFNDTKHICGCPVPWMAEDIGLLGSDRRAKKLENKTEPDTQ